MIDQKPTDDREALVQQINELKDLIEVAPAFFGLLNTSGEILTCNELSVAVIGSTKEEVKGQLFWEAPWWASIPQSAKRVRETILDANNGIVSKIDIHYWAIGNGQGEIRWSAFVVSPIMDTEGKLKHISVSGIDITDRKILENSLRHEEQLFRRLTNGLPQIIFSTSPDGATLFVNDFLCKYTGLKMEDCLGSKWLNFVHPDDREATSAVWQAAISKGEMFSSTFRIRSHDGLHRWHHARARPVFNAQSEIELWIGTASDIHEQILLQSDLQIARRKADAANQAKSHFLTSMSHEIRTPLNAIMGFSELLTNPNISNLDRDTYSSTIKRNGLHLSQLIDDILDLSKVETGKISVEHTKVELKPFLDEIRASLLLQTQEKGLTLVFRSKGKIPEWITTDSLRLRQIIFNIVGNAIKFSHRGGIDITVAFEQTRDLSEKPLMTIKVHDTGIGISTKQQATLFQPFVQADISTTRRFGGTGLGLALSRRLANILGGNVIIAESEVGVGSVFEITIRPNEIGGLLFSYHSENPQAHELSNDQKLKKLAGLKVLVVDDSDDNLLLVEHLLRHESANVNSTNNAADAIKAALTDNYDVMLMDIEMPITDGLEAATKLRQKGYLKPIIGFSAHASPSHKERAFKAGCNDYITKPVDTAHLIQTLSTYCPSLPAEARSLEQ